MGSENGKPISKRSAPASAAAGKSSRVNARSGSPAVTNGMKAARLAARRREKSASMGFMGVFYRRRGKISCTRGADSGQYGGMNRVLNILCEQLADARGAT